MTAAYPHHFVASSPEVVQALMRVAALTANAKEQAVIIDMAATAFMCGVTERGMTALGKAYATGRLTTGILHQLGRDLDTSGLTETLERQALAKRDADLGRWRWPANPDYAVYRDESMDDTSGRYVNVLREPDARTIGLWEDMLRCGSGDKFVQAARAWFAAHPVAKPWHDAKLGEAWVLTIDGTEEPATVGWAMPNEPRFYCGGAEFELDDPGITAGRRIWPEEAS